jgi:SAM-dependent methyltransferase
MDEPKGQDTFSRSEGRVVFASVAGVYAAARPDYPPRVFEILKNRCGLGPSTRVLEIGAGSGQATRALLDVGASVVAVEPSRALANQLEARITEGGDRLETIVAAFEDAPLAPVSFDLVVAASSFHWVDQLAGLRKTADVLRPGGWLALWWNIFGDRKAPDAFRDATDPLLRDLDQSPSAGGRDGVPFALDAAARHSDLKRLGGFQYIEHETIRWTLELDPAEVRRLYSTFSPIARLPAGQRVRILDAIERVASEEFGGRIERRMITPIYTARRSGRNGRCPRGA